MAQKHDCRNLGELTLVTLLIFQWYWNFYGIFKQSCRQLQPTLVLYIQLCWLPIATVIWSASFLCRSYFDSSSNVWMVAHCASLAFGTTFHYLVVTRCRRPVSIPTILSSGNAEKCIVTEAVAIVFSTSASSVSLFMCIYTALLFLFSCITYLSWSNPVFTHISLEVSSDLYFFTASIIASYANICILRKLSRSPPFHSLSRIWPSVIQITPDTKSSNLIRAILRHELFPEDDNTITSYESSHALLYAKLAYLLHYASAHDRGLDSLRGANQCENLIDCCEVWVLPEYRSGGRYKTIMYEVFEFLGLFNAEISEVKDHFYSRTCSVLDLKKHLHGFRYPFISDLCSKKESTNGLEQNQHTETSNGIHLHYTFEKSSVSKSKVIPIPRVSSRGIFDMDHVLLNMVSYNALYMDKLECIGENDYQLTLNDPIQPTWGNLGYWGDGASLKNYPEACERLLIELLVASNILPRISSIDEPDDIVKQQLGLTKARWVNCRSVPSNNALSFKYLDISDLSILDVACGSGDQLLATIAHIVLERGCKRSTKKMSKLKLVGVNLVEAQVEAAHKMKAARISLLRREMQRNEASTAVGKRGGTLDNFLRFLNEDSFQIHQGDATRLEDCLPDAHESFSHVLCLDAAYHFNPRYNFFTQAFKLLKSGGRIALTDLIVHPSLRESLIALPLLRRFAQFASIPSCNIMFEDTYIRQLELVGFNDIRIRYIDDSVLLGFPAFVDQVIKPSSHSEGMSRGMWSTLDWLSPKATRKFRITATFLKYASVNKLLRYAIISATKL